MAFIDVADISFVEYIDSDVAAIIVLPAAYSACSYFFLKLNSSFEVKV